MLTLSEHFREELFRSVEGFYDYEAAFKTMRSFRIVTNDSKGEFKTTKIVKFEKLTDKLLIVKSLLGNEIKIKRSDFFIVIYG